MRCILISFFLASFASGVSADARYVVPQSGTAVIDGPGTVYRTVARLGHGAKVDVQQVYNGYALIRQSNGVDAWVKAGDLAASMPKQPSPKVVRVAPYTSVVWTKAGPLNMRDGPGLGHQVQSQCQRGDWVEVVAVAGDWAQVRLVGGKQGWVHRDYLTR